MEIDAIQRSAYIDIKNLCLELGIRCEAIGNGEYIILDISEHPIHLLDNTPSEVYRKLEKHIYKTRS